MFIADMYCDFWDVEKKENGIFVASTQFSFNYKHEEESQWEYEDYSGYCLTYQNGKCIDERWGLDEEFRDSEEVKEALMKKLEEEQMIKTLEKALTMMPHFDERDRITVKEETRPHYNKNATEYWFEIEGIPAKFMMLYGDSGSVINTRMVLHEYPENDLMLMNNQSFVTFFKEKSCKRLKFLYD